MKKKEEIRQEQILKEYFLKNPDRDISHPEIVDWVTQEYKKHTGKVFRDPDRGIRKLHQQGWLVKIGKGIYRHDPNNIANRNLKDFLVCQKPEVFQHGR